MFAALAIIAMTLATIAIAIFVLAPRMAPGRIVFGLAPDRPHPFGYRMAWLAIRSRDTARVIDAIGISQVEPANWSTGLGIVYSDKLAENHIYISPPVNGWTFVVGLPLPHPLGSGFVDKSLPFLHDLGAQFTEVQYYFAYPPIDYFAWARVINGRLVRAFAIGDDGILWSKGKPTPEEKAINLRLVDLRSGRGRKSNPNDAILLHPTEDHVLRLAGKWSIDPTRIDMAPCDPALGYVGRAPTRWRAERVRQAA